ncbi:hypothetical protein GGR54DRAFT_79131 [Hypoxylon sp. NC1633]|nr:hypothetical protein GGR54DRAFT_79131 [Hypoxylon sp. NC1633]
MAHPRCPAHSSPARALHQVLVSDLLSSSRSRPQHASYYYLFPPRLFCSTSSGRLLARRSTPTASITPAAAAAQHVRPLTTTPSLRRIESLAKRVINGKIPHTWVRIAAPQPDGGLSPPQQRDQVLASLNPKTHTLVMVAPPPPASSGGDGGVGAAICRIVDNAAANAVAAETERRARRKAVDTKELEFSWGIAGHDLGHKLRRMRDFLARGLNVEVLLARKKRGRAATREEAEALVASVREAVASVEGAKEGRKMDGAVGGVAKLFFEGAPEGKRRRKGEESPDL